MNATGVIGRSAQTAVRHVRVRTKHEQVVGVINIGHRNVLRTAEHKAARNVHRHLINRRRTENVACSHRTQHDAAKQLWPQVVRVGVAQIRRECTATVTFDHTHQTAFYFFPRFVPRHFNVHTVALHHRLAQTIGVFMQLLQGAALRTNKPMAEHIVFVAANTHHLFLWVHSDFQTAGGLTQRTGAENGAVLVASHAVTLPRTGVASYT